MFTSVGVPSNARTWSAVDAPGELMNIRVCNCLLLVLIVAVSVT
jgi:hypothetical protein